MPSVYGPLDLLKNELRNAVVQSLGSPPSSPVAGQLYFDSTGGDLTLYWYDGSQWVAAKGGAGTTLGGTAAAIVVGGAGTGGISTDASRADHVHSLPGFGASTAETAFGTAKGDGSAGTFARSDHTHGNPVHDGAAHSSISISSLALPTADVPWNSKKITGLLDPTSAQDAATKNYVDNLSAGLAWKDSVRAATTANITLSAAQTIDGVSVIVGDRVLVKNQTTAANNGIYLVASGAWTRTTDADLGTEVENMCVFVSEGTTLADTAWVCTTNAPITVGSTSLAFAQFGAGATYTGGAGITQTGNTFDIVATDTTITVGTDTIGVNKAVVMTRYAAAITGTVAYATGEVVTHNLGTRDVHVSVINGSAPYQSIEVDWEATSTTTVTLRYSPNIGAGYRAVVIG